MPVCCRTVFNQAKLRQCSGSALISFLFSGIFILPFCSTVFIPSFRLLHTSPVNQTQKAINLVYLCDRRKPMQDQSIPATEVHHGV